MAVCLKSKFAFKPYESHDRTMT